MRLVLRDEQTGHFLYNADYSTANGDFIGFIFFVKLRSYDNATWMQLRQISLKDQGTRVKIIY